LELEESLNTINTILSNATHLQKLRYKTYKSDLSFGQSIERQILPVLVDSFYQLTSLSLPWHHHFHTGSASRWPDSDFAASAHLFRQPGWLAPNMAS
jgi:hypothetical protein